MVALQSLVAVGVLVSTGRPACGSSDQCSQAGMKLRIAELAQRSAIVMVQHDEPAGAVAHLAHRGIIVDHRPGFVRISPHFYNTEEEIDRCVDALATFQA